MSVHELNASVRKERRKWRDTYTLDERRTELSFILDETNQSLAAGEDVAATVDRLVGWLHELRAGCDRDTWAKLVPIAQAHPVGDCLLQDPFTRRSFEKPRGYSGDGVLLDLLYRHPSIHDLVAASSRLGREIYACTSVSDSARAVQERRSILAGAVDATAERTTDAEILSVACGHLREAELSGALADGRLKRWLALDQDHLNLATVARDWKGTVVEPMPARVKELIGGTYDTGTFDLAYTAGVYDYLPRENAVLLTRRLVDLVKPGGEVLFANFSTEVVPDGYMETFMNWPLILRDEAGIWDIVNASVDRNTVEADVFFGENRHIIYAKIRRKAG